VPAAKVNLDDADVEKDSPPVGGAPAEGGAFGGPAAPGVGKPGVDDPFGFGPPPGVGKPGVDDPFGFGPPPGVGKPAGGGDDPFGLGSGGSNQSAPYAIEDDNTFVDQASLKLTSECDLPFEPPDPFSTVSFDDDRGFSDCSSEVNLVKDRLNDNCETPNLDCQPCDVKTPTSVEGWDFENSVSFGFFWIKVAAWRPEDEALANAAIRFLQDNEDIVRWVACLLEGPSDADCVVDHIFGRGLFGDQDLVMDTKGAIWIEDDDIWTDLVTPAIHILQDSDFWQEQVTAFENASGDELVCVVANCAAALLHELLHGCLDLVNENIDNPNTCDTTYMVENAFMWAIAQRFSGCFSGTSCWWADDDCVWMNDDSASLNNPPDCDDLQPDSGVGGGEGGGAGIPGGSKDLPNLHL
jgi:hypothetical protein